MNNWLQATPPSASYRSVYPTNTGLCASKEKKEMPPFVQDCKRDLSQNPVEDWEKGIQTFLWRFSSPSSSSLRWLLATYKPSEHPKPRATQHFWGQARKAWGKSWSLCCHVQRQQESWFCLQYPAFPLKWVFSLHKCGRVGGQNKRHFIENDGGHEGSSKRKYLWGGGWGGVSGALLEMVKPHQCLC